MDPNPLQYLGTSLAMIVGFTGLLMPRAMKNLLGLDYVNPVGLIEIRVLFGSFLVALPMLALIKADAEIFEFYGFAALSAAIIKSLFTILDKCPLGTIYIGILVDVILAVLLMSSLFLG